MRLFKRKKKDDMHIERGPRFSSLVPTCLRQERLVDDLAVVNDSIRSMRAEGVIDTADEHGMTMLHVASMKGCVSTVQRLLQNGANVNPRVFVPSGGGNAKDDGGYTPLHCAAREERLEVTKLLLKNNARVDARSSYNGLTPLHIAAQTGNVPIAETLLNHGASIYSESIAGAGETLDSAIPLHFALKADRQSLGMVKLLLTFGADDKYNNNDRSCYEYYSETTLRLACNTKDYTIIAYIFMYHIEQCDEQRRSRKYSLLGAVSGLEMEYAEIARHVSKSIFPPAVEKINSPLLLSAMLHSAVELGYFNIVKDLSKRGVDIRTSHCAPDVHAGQHFGGNFQCTLLHTATKHSRIDIAKLLISLGIDVNVRDENQRTPIYFAIENLDVRMTKILLNHGAIT